MVLPAVLLGLAVLAALAWIVGRGVILRAGDPPGRVTFMDEEGRLFLAAPASGEVTRLQTSPDWHGTPSLSPPDEDGEIRLAYAVERREETHIYVRPLGTQAEVQLTFAGKANLLPRWSPDGRQIAFMSDRTCVFRGSGGTGQLDAASQIFVMAADGSEPRCLTRGLAVSIFPSWSPDGRQIAYMDNESGNAEIYVVEVASGEVRALTEDPAHDSQPAWSPDGRQIAFMSDRGGMADIWLVGAQGGEPRNLTDAPESQEGQPDWSPDGRWIAFTSDRTGKNQIFIMEVSSGEVRQLTEGPAEHFMPHWGP